MSSMSPTYQRANLRMTADRLESGSARLTPARSAPRGRRPAGCAGTASRQLPRCQPFCRSRRIAFMRLDCGYSMPYGRGHDKHYKHRQQDGSLQGQGPHPGHHPVVADLWEALKADESTSLALLLWTGAEYQRRRTED